MCFATDRIFEGRLFKLLIDRGVKADEDDGRDKEYKDIRTKLS